MVIVKSIIHSIVDLDRQHSLLSDVKIFSPYERDYCLSKSEPLPSLAGIWCAKEAFSHAIANVDSFPACLFLDVEVRHDSRGRPWINLNDSLNQWCQENGMAIDLSISHAGDFAAASISLDWLIEK